MILSVYGSFGETLTIRHIRVTMSRLPDGNLDVNCTKADWPEVVNYELTMTWPDPGDAIEPWVAIGNHPYNVLWWDKPTYPFKSGVTYIVSTCHLPGDSHKAKVEIPPPGGDLYRWYFH